MKLKLRRPLRIGLALDCGSMTAVPLEGPGSTILSYSLNEAADPAVALESGFRELQQHLGDRSTILHVALLPTLVPMRRLELPPLRQHEERRVLIRDAGKYFLGIREPQVTASVTLSKPRTLPREVLAAAVPQRWLDALHAAAEETGFSVGSVIPASCAWASAVKSAQPQFQRGAALGLFLSNEAVDMVALGNGELEAVSRIPVCHSVPIRLKEELRARGTVPRVVALCGSEEIRPKVADELPESDIITLVDTGRGDTFPAAVAARYAGATSRLQLLRNPEFKRRQRRSRRISGAMWVAAVALLLGAAGIHLWGVREELEAIRTQRAAIRANVQEVLEIRNTLNHIGSRVEFLELQDVRRTRWAPILSELADRLPTTAYLDVFHAHGDSINLQGMSREPANIEAQIAESSMLVGVASNAGAENVLVDDEGSSQRFELIGRVVKQSTTPRETSP